MKNNIKNKKIENLFKTILSLDNIDEAQMFFRDLCTIEEVKDMSERFEIAKLVNEGMTYREIAKKLDISTTTVSRVAYWLKNGTGGYQLLLNKINHHKNPSGKRR